MRHYAITADGTIHQLLYLDKVSNGVQGYNSTTTEYQLALKTYT